MPERRFHRAPSAPVARLHAIRHLYGPALAEEKLALLALLARRPIRSARRLRAVHDDLLFLRAFPDSPAVHAAACEALARLHARVRRLAVAERQRLDDSGIAGTVTRHAFTLGVVQWMEEEGEEGEIEWDALDRPERLDPLLRLTLTPAEGDAFDSGEFSTRSWMRLARGDAVPRSLGWLVHTPPPAERGTPKTDGPDPTLVRLLYDSLDVPIRWPLSFARSTSGNGVAPLSLAVRTGMRPPPADPIFHVATPLSSIARLPRTRALQWLGAARAALAARCREVHAITYANVDEVYLADLGEGTALCVIGAARQERLTLEANYGYVLFANGVPVGYGGVTPLAAQANTGVNIFEAFRHAEAGMLFAQALRAFRSLFGVTRFVVNPYQVGADNDEALVSGAYWFYDRLGFRPTEAPLRVLADRERQRRLRDRSHRSSLAVLRRLASSDLVMTLPGAHDTATFDERWLVTLASAVTVSLQSRDVTQRLAIRDAQRAAVARALGISSARAASDACAFGLQRLAPIVALILDDVRTWPSDERQALAALICAKGATQERGFAIASREHGRLWGALRRYCRRRDGVQKDGGRGAG
jgi:hypothetical protein